MLSYPARMKLRRLLPVALWAVTLLPLFPMQAQQPVTAEIQTTPLTYQIDGKTYEGSLSRPAQLAGNAPGILVAHDWTGYGPFTRARAEDLAHLGYIALALDMYGQGVHAANPGEAGKLSAPFYQDPQLFRRRAQAALDELRRQPGVDPARLGAIGFCFGGTTVLELVRAGAPLAAVVTFHGGLKTSLPAPERTGQMNQELLILNGALDPLIPPADVAAFMTEMNHARIPYKLVEYPNTVHAYTNPEAGNDPAKPTAYNPQSAEAAFSEMRAFFNRRFAP